MKTLMYACSLAVISGIFIACFPGSEKQVNLDTSSAQLALSHGHCNLPIKGIIRAARVQSQQEDLSDITVDFEIDMTSLIANIKEDGAYTRHIRSEKAFNTDEFPLMTFQCTDNFRLGDNWYQLRGNLTICGHSQSVLLRMTPVAQGENIRLVIEGKVNLFDFGIAYEEMDGNQVHAKEKIMFINLELESSAHS